MAQILNLTYLNNVFQFLSIPSSSSPSPPTLTHEAMHWKGWTNLVDEMTTGNTRKEVIIKKKKPTKPHTRIQKTPNQKEIAY